MGLCVCVYLCPRVYESLYVCVCACPSKLRQCVGLSVWCVYESLSVCVSMSAPGEGFYQYYSIMVNEVARRPPKPPTGSQAVTAQLIVVSI